METEDGGDVQASGEGAGSGGGGRKRNGAFSIGSRNWKKKEMPAAMRRQHSIKSSLSIACIQCMVAVAPMPRAADRDREHVKNG